MIEAVENGRNPVVLTERRMHVDTLMRVHSDTLFLTLPLSWRGMLTQYAGWHHRVHEGQEGRDHIGLRRRHVPVLAKMHEGRRAGYRALAYEIAVAERNAAQLSFGDL